MPCSRTLIRIDQEAPGGSKQEELDLSKTIQVYNAFKSFANAAISFPTQGAKNSNLEPSVHHPLTWSSYLVFSNLTISRARRSPTCFWTPAATTFSSVSSPARLKQGPLSTTSTPSGNNQSQFNLWIFPTMLKDHLLITLSQHKWFADRHLFFVDRATNSKALWCLQLGGLRAK